jgi:hypothetical protein
MVTKRTGNRRLLKLAAFLETLPRRKFDYMTWSSSIAPGEYTKDLCGTTGCAMGWACTMPEFRRLGLRMHFGIPSFPSKFEGGWARGNDAADELFGLSGDEAYKVFHPRNERESKATPKYVAEKIRAFVVARGGGH